MASSKAAQSYEMLIIGRMIIGFNCGTTLNKKKKSDAFKAKLMLYHFRIEYVIGPNVYF